MSSSSKSIALTGGIGCGKTTVLREFERLGIPCFVADEWGRKIYSVPAFRERVGERFGTLDRKEIARIVFADKGELEWLNRQVHPIVMELFEKWRAQQNAPYVIFESAILYENHLEQGFDKVICVYLDKEERLRRLSLRDHATLDDLEARMRNQLSAEEKMARADYVILNYEGNPRRRQVAYIDNLIRNI